MSERPFSVAFIFAILVLTGLNFVGFVYLPPQWTPLNIGMHVFGLAVCLVNYINEFHGMFQLTYSKFAKQASSVNPRFGWVISYALPAVVYTILWYMSGKPMTNYHLIALATYNLHFLKRILECMFLHKYSTNIDVATIIQIGGFYSLGAVMQHYWCNIVTSSSLAAKLSQNQHVLVTGMVIFVLGEFINFVHHAILATLRPKGGSKYMYVIPTGGLFSMVICPHYFGELIAWLGMSILYQHSCLYLSWLTMVAYLSGRSHQTRLWYLKKFDKFPQHLKNLFPGIY